MHHMHTRTHAELLPFCDNMQICPTTQLIISATCIINSQSPSSFFSLPFSPPPLPFIFPSFILFSHVADDRAPQIISCSHELTSALLSIWHSRYRKYSLFDFQQCQASGQAWFSPLGGSSNTWRRWQTCSTDHCWPDAKSNIIYKENNQTISPVIIKRQELIDKMSHSLFKSTFLSVKQMWEEWTLDYAVSLGEEGSGNQLDRLHSAATLVITWGQGTHTHRLTAGFPSNKRTSAKS